jgi:hypothetical protein
MTSDNPKVVARGVNLTGTHFRESYKVDYGLGDDVEGAPRDDYSGFTRLD